MFRESHFYLKQSYNVDLASEPVVGGLIIIYEEWRKFCDTHVYRSEIIPGLFAKVLIISVLGDQKVTADDLSQAVGIIMPQIRTQERLEEIGLMSKNLLKVIREREEKEKTRDENTARQALRRGIELFRG